MQNIISRYMISDNFIGLPLHVGHQYDKKELVSKIDLWKYVLKYKCAAQSGESILIGIQTLNIDYLAVCFAAAELSLKIVIVDYTRNDNFSDVTYYDPKTKILSPIDIFLHDFSKKEIEEMPNAYSKFIFFSNCSNRTYSIKEIDFTVDDKQFEIAKNIFPDPSTVVMRCTSSGTTGTPKIVEHTHEFLYKVSIRNSKKFSGKCLHVRNLNHGSSLAVYLLPTLISDKVTGHTFNDLDEMLPMEDFINDIYEFRNDLEFMIFPYPFMIDSFIDVSIKNNIQWPNLNVQTLSYIQDKSKQAIAQGVFRSITSIFGSNETSGPIFTAVIDKSNVYQDSAIFDHVDDFYKIKIYQGGLLGVTLPVYDTEIITNDLFELQGVSYKHKGRSDLVKINGEVLDIKIVNDLNNKNTNLYLVTDTVKNCLYLAFWDDTDSYILNECTNFFKNNFKRIEIVKTAVLNKHKFLTGIKIDNELLREYFRNYV